MPEFIKLKGGKDGTVAKIMGETNRQDVCFITGTYLVCVSSDKAKGNQNIDARLPRLLEVRARNSMYRHLIFKTDKIQFKNKEIYYNVCSKLSNDEARYLPSGIESTSSTGNGFVYSAISIPYQKSIDEFAERSRAFGKKDYCTALFDNAVSYEKQEKYSDAIACLQEFISLKPDSKQGYILLSKCYLKTKQNADALKCIRYAFEQFYESLSSKELEDLGDIFIALKENQEAVKAFNLASARYDGK